MDLDDILPENIITKMLEVVKNKEVDIFQGNWYTFQVEKQRNKYFYGKIDVYVRISMGEII